MAIMRRRLFVFLLALGLTACNRNQSDTRQVGTSGEAATENLSDGWITTTIQAQYFADPEIKSRRLHVDTNDRVVTVTGVVNKTVARQRAIEIAGKTTGVRRVEDRLTVGGPVEPPADLATRASNGTSRCSTSTTRSIARVAASEMQAANISVSPTPCSPHSSRALPGGRVSPVQRG